MRVLLNGTFGYEGRYYGPGECDVPAPLAAALGLEPLAKVEPAETPSGPFDAFSETVRTSLEAANIRTVDDLKGKTEADLVALRGVGEATAKDLLKLAPAE